MRIFNLTSAAEKALTSALRSVPCYSPSFTVRAASGFILDASTATGAFRAIQRLAPSDRETARVYDDNGYCLYR